MDDNAKKPFITVNTEPAISGYMAIHMEWNSDYGGFYEPYQTGIGRYSTIDEAIVEAKYWAESYDMEFVDPRDLS